MLLRKKNECLFWRAVSFTYKTRSIATCLGEQLHDENVYDHGKPVGSLRNHFDRELPFCALLNQLIGSWVCDTRLSIESPTVLVL